MDKKFIKLPKEFWQNNEIRKQSGSMLKFLIDLLFISYSFNHKPFYQTSKQLYEKCEITNRMDLSRKKEQLEELDIKIEKSMKKYYFDLSKFFIKYYKM